MKRPSLTALAAVFCLSAFALACTGSPRSGDPITSTSQTDSALVPTPTTPVDPMQSARSAAPSSISANAAIMDWGLDVVSPGANEWTCLPNRPDTPGNEP